MTKNEERKEKKEERKEEKGKEEIYKRIAVGKRNFVGKEVFFV